MSENLMPSIAPQLAPPVSREPIRSAADGDEGAEQLVFSLGAPLFVDDDAE